MQHNSMMRRPFGLSQINYPHVPIPAFTLRAPNDVYDRAFVNLATAEKLAPHPRAIVTATKIPKH